MATATVALMAVHGQHHRLPDTNQRPRVLFRLIPVADRDDAWRRLHEDPAFADYSAFRISSSEPLHPSAATRRLLRELTTVSPAGSKRTALWSPRVINGKVVGALPALDAGSFTTRTETLLFRCSAARAPPDDTELEQWIRAQLRLASSSVVSELHVTERPAEYAPQRPRRPSGQGVVRYFVETQSPAGRSVLEESYTHRLKAAQDRAWVAAERAARCMAQRGTAEAELPRFVVRAEVVRRDGGPLYQVEVARLPRVFDVTAIIASRKSRARLETAAWLFFAVSQEPA